MSTSPRCAEMTRGLGVDPIGTAGRYDTVVLLERPLPWPADVTADPIMAPLRELQRTRLLAVLPLLPAATMRVTVWRRVTPTAYQGLDYDGLVEDVTRQLLPLVVEGSSDDRIRTSRAPQEVLICGHGSRDRCCGSMGTRLHAAATAAFPAVRIRRSSHLGGHRFAPTGLTFPDGRAWAFMDEALIESLLSESGEANRVLQHCRGSMALEPVAQAAEREIESSVGWSWRRALITSVEMEERGATTAVEIRWTYGSSRGRAVVDVERETGPPVAICGLPLDRSMETECSYRPSLRSLEIDAGIAPGDS